MSKSYLLADIAKKVNGELIGSAHFSVTALSSLVQAQASHISFVTGEKHLDAANRSQAGVLIVTADLVAQLTAHQQFIVVDQPYLAFAILTHLFEVSPVASGIQSTAKIDCSAIISDDASIGHYTVIGENCVIGAGANIASNVSIGDGVEIGRNCYIEANVTLSHCRIGDGVRIHRNTAIGGEGFGFAPYQGRWHRIAQLGLVIIGNQVRIGSNCSVDRGALDDTIIQDGVIIDNLVQIAHNVQIGANTAIAAKSAIAGSTKIGKNCTLAGAVGVVGHIEIGDNVTFTAMSMVTKSFLEPGTYSSGIPATDNSSWKRAVIRFRQLADVPLTKIVKQIDHMQSQIESIESTLKLRK